MLAPAPATKDLTDLKDKLLDRTLAMLPARRRWRRLAMAGALAACFAAGMLTMWLLRPGLAAADPSGPAQGQPARESPLTRPLAQEDKGSTTALAKEWQAFDSTEERIKRFVQAGDQYLQEGEDLDGALRCYRQAVASASPDQLAVEPTDNWLVMALKTARRKEIERVKNSP
jgi:hypothetical protein